MFSNRVSFPFRCPSRPILLLVRLASKRLLVGRFFLFTELAAVVHFGSTGPVMFHVRRRPADQQARRRKKKLSGSSGGGGGGGGGGRGGGGGHHLYDGRSKIC